MGEDKEKTEEEKKMEERVGKLAGIGTLIFTILFYVLAVVLNPTESPDFHRESWFYAIFLLGGIPPVSYVIILITIGLSVKLYRRVTRNRKDPTDSKNHQWRFRT